MNRFHTLTLSAALALGAIAAPALSQQIIVTPEMDVAIAEVSRDLDRQLAVTSRLDRRTHESGFAILRFQRGADGRPENVSFYRRSGNIGIDHLARRAVKRLGKNAALPHTGNASQLYQANIIVADSRNTHRVLSDKLARFEAERIAAERGTGAVLAFAGNARDDS